MSNVLEIARLERLATSRAAAASFAEDSIGADFAAEESLYETNARRSLSWSRGLALLQ